MLPANVTPSATASSHPTAAVHLDAARDEDFERLYQWMNDVEELALWSMRRKQLLFQDVVDFVRERSRSGLFTVVRHRESAKPIGFLEGAIRERDGVAEFAVYIGKDWRKRRDALQGIGLFVEYLFLNYPIRKAYCQAYAYNLESIRLLLSGGFEEEGRFRNLVWSGDRYWDLHVYALDRATWEDGLRGRGRCGRFLRVAGLLGRNGDTPAASADGGAQAAGG